MMRSAAALPGRLARPAPPHVRQRPTPKGLLLWMGEHFTWVLMVGLLLAHIAFAQEVHSMPVRVLSAIPGILFLMEGRWLIKNHDRQELPIVALGLAQFYANFSLPVFFNVAFMGTGGRTTFSEEARVSASLAAAVGAGSLLLGARIGFRLSPGVRRAWVAALPPATVPKGWDLAVLVYTGAAAAFSLALSIGFSLPAALSIPASFALSLELALGLTSAATMVSVRSRAARLPVFVWLLFGFLALMRGQLEPILRSSLAFFSARWVVIRRISMPLLVAVGAVFVILQPAKSAFRAQVWTGEEAGIERRVTVWKDVLSDRYSSNSHRTDDDTSAADRLAELYPVINAFEVVPQRIEHINGAGFLPIFYGFIPRLLWPDKPTTRDEPSQHYAVDFGFQSEKAAERTAIGINILVEGYWNFGWVGIVLVCAAMGIWLGVGQRVFRRDHWALFAIGVAQVFGTNAVGSITNTYGALFQLVIGRVFAGWMVYLLAKALSSPERARGPRMVRAPARRDPASPI